MNLWYVKVNKHTRDFGGFVTLQLLDEIENCGTDSVFVVRIFRNDGLNQRGATHKVSFLHSGRLLLNLRLAEAWYHIVLLNRHLLHGLHTALQIHADLGVLAHRDTARLLASITICAILALVAKIRARLALILDVVRAAYRLGSRAWPGLALWHLLKELLEHLKEHFGLVAHSRLLQTVLLTEAHEVNLVLVLFVLELADFLDFVVVDDEGAALEVTVVEIRDRLGGMVWPLEAHEAVWVLALLLGEESDTLDLAVLAEEIPDVFFLAGLWDVFDEKVALLLGVLVFHGFAQNLLFAGLSVQERLHVNLLAVDLLAI